mmetsp:Transcript_21488/g.52611  ORF Transcript_21488/g.52611 Transcript_21488/m.52611 type:complete len:183 (-) Transcript_21488:414-962(-)
MRCEVQERFRTLCYNMAHVIHTSKQMAAAAKTLGIPLLVTEQYPKALLHTVSEIDISGAQKFEKTQFSMCIPEVWNWMTTKEMRDRRSVVLFGIEAHVCVQQTALDLIAAGYSVHVLADGVSSQRALDRSAALQRMQGAGAVVTTSESVLFELMKTKDNPVFKAISELSKERPPPENQLSSL